MTQFPSITMTKEQVALHQLECALSLFLDDDDYVSAITLAGASDEILGKLLEARGESPELREFAASCVAIGKRIYKKEWPEKDFVEMANYFRNGLKHITDGAPIEIPRSAATEILDRAVSSYWRLCADETPLMQRFREAEHGV